MFGRLVHYIRVRIRWASIMMVRLIRFLTHDIWFLKEEDFSRWTARLVRDAKTVILMMSTFTDQKIGYQITALAYRSMLAVVPAIAIGFYLTDGLGLREKFADVLIANLGEQHITEVLLTAADNIVKTAETGLFGFISMASFVWIVLSLMITVRRVFNNVWKQEKEENVLGMVGVIIGITLLAPFVVMIFFSGSVLYSHVLDLLFPSQLFFSARLKNLMTWTLFAALSVLVLSAMYKYIPGTRVRYRHALKAALISGLVFTGIQYLYLETQVMVAKQSAVYGVIAALPLFMIWLNLGWTVILYGAELSYAFQNVKQTEETIRSRRHLFQKNLSL